MAPVTIEPALPGLELLQQPVQFREHLSRVLTIGRQADGERVLDAGFSVRRYVPGKRCVVDIEVTIGDSDGLGATRRKLVGKLYNRDQGERVFDTLQRLREGPFGAGQWLVPEPLAYDAGSRLLVLRWTEGALLRDLLLAGAEVGPQIQAAAEWLARFHASGLAGGRQYGFSRHLHTLAGWQRAIAEQHPGEGPLLREALARIEDRGGALAGWTPGPTHRDFSPDHLVYDGDRVTVLDFDEFCQYDPLFDVAHFAAHVRFLGLTAGKSLAYFEAAATRFEAEYAACGPLYCGARVALYRAISDFKLAHIVAVVKRPPDSQDLVHRLLAEALQQLSGEQA